MGSSEVEVMVETAKGALVSTLASQTPKLNLNLTQLSSFYRHSPSPCKTFNIEARNLSYKLAESSKRWLKTEEGRSKSRYLLKDVNCRAKPWEILAIAGPSGAGKSTLLELLAGRLNPNPNPTCGILVNDVASDSKHLRRISGYITQDDALFPFLTVEETLLFSAKLRLRGSTDEDKRFRVRALLKDLRLDHVAGSRIGNDKIRGVSGGERRRVSIGVDVIHDPAVLLLDEPTSGLDSFSALQIIKIVKSMAEVKGRTVILTIHQPGFRILELFNSILLLSNGFSVHQGSLAKLKSKLVSAGCEIPPHVNILDYAMDAIGALQVKNNNNSIENIQGRVKVTLYDLFLINITETAGAEGEEDSPNGERLYEIWVLSHRFLLNVVRSKQLFRLKIVQAVAAGLCLGSIFYKAERPEERLGLLAFSLTFLLSCATEGLPIFVEEREILKRETYSGAYRVSSYVIANAIVFLPLMLVVSVVFSVPVYFLVGLNAQASAFFYFVMVIWLGIYAANSLVALFSALVPNYMMGTTLITGCLGSFFLFSGFFVSKSDIPKYWMFMHYMSVFKYPLEALLINEYSGSEDKCLANAWGKCVMNVGDVMKEQGIKDSDRWMDVVVMLAFICAYRFFSWLALTWTYQTSF